MGLFSVFHTLAFGRIYTLMKTLKKKLTWLKRKKKHPTWQELNLLTNEVEVTWNHGVNLVVNVSVTKQKYNKLLLSPPLCYCDTENKAT